MRTRTTMTSGAPWSCSGQHVRGPVYVQPHRSLTARVRRCPNCRCYDCNAFTHRCVVYVGKCRNCGVEIEVENLAEHEKQCVGAVVGGCSLLVCEVCRHRLSARGISPPQEGVEYPDQTSCQTSLPSGERSIKRLNTDYITCVLNEDREKERVADNFLFFCKGKCCKKLNSNHTFSVCRGECNRKSNEDEPCSICYGSYCKRYGKSCSCDVCSDLLPHIASNEGGTVSCRGHVFECTTCKQVFTTAVEYAMHLCCGRTDAEPRSTTGSMSQFDGMGRDANFKPAWETMCASLQPTERTTTSLSTLSQSPTCALPPAEPPVLCPTLVRQSASRSPGKPREKLSNSHGRVRNPNKRKLPNSQRRSAPPPLVKGLAGVCQPATGLKPRGDLPETGHEAQKYGVSAKSNRASSEGVVERSQQGQGTMWKPLPLVGGAGGQRIVTPSCHLSAVGSLKSSAPEFREQTAGCDTMPRTGRSQQPDDFIPIVEKDSPTFHQNSAESTSVGRETTVSVSSLMNRIAAPLILLSPRRTAEVECTPITVEVITEHTTDVDEAVKERVF